MTDRSDSPPADASSRADGALLTRAGNEFEAAVIVAMLADHGIDALAGPASSAPLSAALRGERPTTPVLVRSEDLDRARDALRRMRDGSLSRAASEEEASDPVVADAPARIRARPGRSMLASAPLLAVIGWVAAVGIIVLTMLAVLVGLVT